MEYIKGNFCHLCLTPFEDNEDVYENNGQLYCYKCANKFAYKTFQRKRVIINTKTKSSFKAPNKL